LTAAHKNAVPAGTQPLYQLEGKERFMHERIDIHDPSPRAYAGRTKHSIDETSEGMVHARGSSNC